MCRSAQSSSAWPFYGTRCGMRHWRRRPGQYFGESNVEAMLITLMPLHEMMARNGPTTLKEIAFVQVRPLLQAIPCVCNPYAGTSNRDCTFVSRGTRGLASERPACVGLCMLTPLRKEQAPERHACVWPRRTGGSCRRRMIGAKGTSSRGGMQSCTRPGTCTITCSSASTSSCPPSQSWSCNMSPQLLSELRYGLQFSRTRILGLVSLQANQHSLITFLIYISFW